MAYRFYGAVAFQSSLSLEEVGEVISESMFGGVPFGGKELEIHEEIPCIFIDELIFGLRIELDGYSGFSEKERFALHVSNDFFPVSEGEREEMIRLEDYIYHLMKFTFRDVKEIKILKPVFPK